MTTNSMSSTKERISNVDDYLNSYLPTRQGYLGQYNNHNVNSPDDPFRRGIFAGLQWPSELEKCI